MISEHATRNGELDAANFDPVTLLSKKFDEKSRIPSIAAYLDDTKKFLTKTEQEPQSAVEAQANYYTSGGIQNGNRRSPQALLGAHVSALNSTFNFADS